MSTIMLDFASKRAFVVADDALFTILSHDLAKVAEEFDKTCSGDMRGLNAATTEICVLLGEAKIYAEGQRSDLLDAIFCLCLNALQTTLGALQLTRNGFRLQPGMLIRGAIETVCAVCHLCIVPGTLAKLQQNKFDSKESMRTAKKVLEPIVEHWGRLSTDFVHIGDLHIRQNPLVPYAYDDTSLEVNLMNIRLCLWLIKVVVELAFYSGLKEHAFWKKEGDGLAYDPTETTRTATVSFLKDRPKPHADL